MKSQIHKSRNENGDKTTGTKKSKQTIEININPGPSLSVIISNALEPPLSDINISIASPAFLN